MRRVSVPFSNSDAMQESFQDHFAQFDFGFTLTASKTALMIIDMQYASASRDMGMGRRLNLRGQDELGRYRFDRIEKTCVPTIQRLLQFFRAHGLRIIYLTIGSNLSDYMDMPQNLREVARANNNRKGEREHEILDALKPQSGEIILNKTTTGGFASTSLDSTLRTFGLHTLAFCGVSTDQCVESTARVAADLGYNCIIVEDGCGASSSELHDATMKSFRRILGRVSSSVTLMNEISAQVLLQSRPRKD